MRKNINIILTGTILCLPGVIAGKEKPNILWIITEDLSPLFGCYGDPNARTPFLDSLAQHSVVYENVYSVAPISAPSRSGLITGVYPNTLGTAHLRQDQFIPEWFECFPEYLNKIGYHTSLQGKADFNFPADGIFIDSNSHGAELWRNRKEGQSFFTYRNASVWTHEGAVNFEDKYLKSTRHIPEEMRCNPSEVILPPYYPDTDEMRKIYARYYDLSSSLDRDIKNVFKQLETDGLLESTIVFIFSDHGNGLPRYKRWLNITGVNVPLVVYIPDKFEHLSKNKKGEVNKDLISMIDFAPTVLNLAGTDIPEHMDGKPFMGENLPKNRDYVFVSRDRADDMFEVSRAIITDRYIYVRHYMPYLPYIQSGVIFGDHKESLRELRRAYKEDPNGRGKEMWNMKPVEELYDLKLDPQETNNVAFTPAYSGIKEELSEILHNHLVEIRDVTLLPEPEMMERSKNKTSYELALSSDYDIQAILSAAEKVGIAPLEEFLNGLNHPDSGVRYWSIIGLRNMVNKEVSIPLNRLSPLLKDESASCQIAAAELIALLGYPQKALPILEKWLKDDAIWNKLFAARAVEQIAPFSAPLNSSILEVLDDISTEQVDGIRTYKDFNLYSFTGWALESALKKNGYPIKSRVQLRK